jgi:uncharacterized protein YdaU (DUF1376 family)
MAEKPPYFPMYPKDLMGDDLVRVMDTMEFGAYVRLLCAAWVATPACTVPDDDTELARLAGLSNAQWNRAKSRVMRPWKRLKNGRWVQPRLMKEFRRVAKQKASKIEAGRKGGLAKAARQADSQPSTASPVLQHPKPYPKPEPKPNPEPEDLDLESPNPLSGDWQLELARGLSGYAREKAGLALEFQKLTELALEFGWPEVTQALEHRASMKPHRRWRGKGGQPVANKIGVLVNTVKAFASGNGPDNEGDVETYQEWRARREAEIGALR